MNQMPFHMHIGENEGGILLIIKSTEKMAGNLLKFCKTVYNFIWFIRCIIFTII